MELNIKYPSIPAFFDIDSEKSISYNDLLNFKANFNPNSRVVLIGDKSLNLFSYLYYCLTNNITFTIIPTSIPTLRQKNIIDQIKPNYIVHTDSNKIQKLHSKTFEPLAYIWFTSGSTGIPKGARIAKEALMHVIGIQTRVFNYNNSRTYLIPPLNFDASLSDILCTLKENGTLYFSNSKLSPKLLYRICSKYNISHIDLPPSYLPLLKPQLLPELTIILGGEVLPINKIELSEWLSKHKLFCVYGPTEATICSSIIPITSKYQQGDIGKPIEGVSYSLTDKNELVIKGKTLMTNYLHLDDTPITEYFTKDIVTYRDNKYFFVNRIDRQFKINGQMVYPEEIETIINNHSAVLNSHVYKDKISGKLGIKVYSNTPLKVIKKDLILSLQKRLPSYFIPKNWIYSKPNLQGGKAKWT